MRASSPFILVCTAMSLASNPSLADIASFAMIPNAAAANDISPDGRWIVGATNDFRAYRLDRATNTMLLLPPECEQAVAVSDDGSVVVGSIIDTQVNAEVAAIWTESSGVWTSLGYLPNANSCPSRSNGYEVSADGTVVVGLSWDGCSGRGFRWTQATGMVELQNLANGNNRASVVSADGSVIGGFAQGSFSRTPAFWLANATGQLIDPPNGDAVGEIHGINDAGTLLLGNRDGLATTWTFPELAPDVIGTGSILPGWSGVPTDISADGTIVGFDFLLGSRRAWLHRAGSGPMIDLKSYINANGGSVPSNVNLEVCQAISLDGRTIIGHTAFQGAWLATIDLTHCPADIVIDDVVNVSDLLAVIGSWGPCPGACPPRCAADISPVEPTFGDCQVNVSDLLAVISAWGACPPPVGGCCTGDSCTQVSQPQCASIGGVYLGNSVPCAPTTCANNDSCTDAVNITANINGVLVIGDNSTATPGAYTGGNDPELPLGSPSCQWNNNPGSAHSTVWFKFVAPANGSVTIATCSSEPAPFYDSTIALFSGTCGKLLEIGCSEDDCGVPPQAPYYSSLSISSLTPGETYYVSVMNPGDWNFSIPGPFNLTITSP